MKEILLRLISVPLYIVWVLFIAIGTILSFILWIFIGIKALDLAEDLFDNYFDWINNLTE